MNPDEDDNNNPIQLHTLDTNLLPDISSYMEEDQEASVSFGYYKKPNGGLNPHLSISGIQDQNTSNVDKTIVNLFPEVTIDSLPSFDFGDRKQVLFKPITPDTVWMNKKETFIYIRCQMLTTYYYCLIAYSQFSNPHLIENDPRYELKFLYRGNNIDYEGDTFALTPAFSLSRISNKLLEPFIAALNTLSADEKYISIRRRNSKIKQKTNIIFYSMLALCFLLTIGVCVYLFKFLNGITAIFWVIVSLYVVGFVLLLYLMITYKKKYKNARFLLIEHTISHRVKNHLNIEKFISDWNKKLFFPNKVAMWAPISLDYIMFNLCQEHDIQLKHHQMEEMKLRGY